MIKIYAEITIDSTLTTLDNAKLLSLQREIKDRGNIEKPNWGVYSNTGNIEFIDYSGTFLNYSVLLNGTNSEVATIDITYHKNPPTGSDVVEVVADIPKNVSVIMGEDLTTILVSETFGDTYKFKYWAENSDGTGFKYINGNEYILYTSISLYAIWEASA